MNVIENGILIIKINKKYIKNLNIEKIIFKDFGLKIMGLLKNFQ